MSRSGWLGCLSKCLVRASLWPKRHRCYTTSPAYSTENVSIRVGGNSYVNLKIHKPRQETTRKNVLVYLPPSPHLPSYPSSRSKSGSKKLRNALPTTTILEVGYRLGPRTETEDPRFPTPIHDVFAAWDYTRRIIKDLSTPGRGTDLGKPRVCIYGSQVGGALALTLALTEPNSIHAVAIQNPFTDWPVLEELAAQKDSPSTARKQTPKSLLQSPDFLKARAEAAESLIRVRTSLFATPSAYFDSFASPTLFLRAPGRDTPLTKTAAPAEEAIPLEKGELIRYGDGVEEIGLVTTPVHEDAFGPYDDDLHAMSSNAPSPNMPTTLDSNTEADVEIVSQGHSEQLPTDLSYWQPGPRQEKHQSQTRRRKVLRKWPPHAHPEDVLLPEINIVLHELDLTKLSDAGILPVSHTQGLELVDLLRRACFWGREKSFAEERVVLTKLESGNAITMQNEVIPEVVEWLRQKLENP